MTGPWIAAFLALWAVVVLLAVLTLGLLRRVAPALEQVERAAGVGRMMEDLGLPAGAVVPPFEVTDAAGRRVPFADVGPQDRVVLFVDANCPACDAVTTALARRPGPVDLPVVVVPGPATEADHYAALRAAGLELVTQPDGAASSAFRQRAFPLAFAVAGDTVVASKIPGSVADLERLAAALPNPSHHAAEGAA